MTRRRVEIAAPVLSKLADVVVDRYRLTLSILVGLTVVAAIGQSRPEWIWDLGRDLRDLSGRVTSALQPPADPESESASESSPNRGAAYSDRGGPSGATEPPRPGRPVQTPAPEPSPEPPSEPPDVTPLRMAGGDVIVVARSSDFFTPSGAAMMRDVVGSLEALSHVDRVFWLDRIPVLNLFGLPQPLLPRDDASRARFEAARDRASRHPLAAGQVMSPDGETFLLMVDIDWLFVEQDGDCTDRLRDVATQVAEGYPDVEATFAVTGNVPIRLSRAASNRSNEIKYQLIGNVTAIVIALFLFRGLAAVIVVALAPAAGVFWTMGAIRLLGIADNGFTAVILPVLICMIGFTDGVHMMVHIRRRRAAGDSPGMAAKGAIRAVGMACWLTSLTTAIGFGSLMLASEDVVREFGMCCVVGVMLTFVSVATIIPWASATRLGNRIHAGHEGNVIDRGLSRVAGLVHWVVLRSRLVAGVGIAVTAALAFSASRLTPDQRLTSSLDRGSEAAAALQHVDEALGGLETANVVVRWSPEIDSDSGRIAAVVAEVDGALRGEPLIGHPLSLASLLDALPGDGPPETRMSLLDLLPPPLKRAHYEPERRRAEVRFRIRDLGIATYGPVFERLEKRFAAIERDHPGFGVTMEGDAVRRWERLYRVVVDLATSLGTASVIIFVALTVIFRSLRLGLISIVPNLFPLAATGSLILVGGGHLEIVSVCAFTVCLGIAVDDTIHFMTRFVDERRRGKPCREAIQDAFVSVGTALIMTTIVLVIGFGTALLSDARDHRIFATMGILTILTALFADLVFLPALLDRFAPSFADADDSRSSDS